MKKTLLSPAVAALLAMPAASASLAAYTGMKMSTSTEMDDLTAAVTENTDLDDSVVTFLNGVAAQIEQAAGDRVASTALAQKLREHSKAVADALKANTPAAPDA